MKKTLLSLLLTFALFSFTFADHLSDRLMFTARLDGENNTTVLNADAHGIGVFFLNGSWDTMHVNINLANLSGPILGAHIHMGQPGMDGGVAINLTDNIKDNIIRTYITGPDLDNNLADFLGENLYLNIHTEDPIATGEARGQIKLERDFGFYTNLDTAQEVHTPMGGAAIGSGNFILDQNNRNLFVRVITSGLSGDITGAHLHKAAAGMNGPVVLNLGPLIEGTRLDGSIALPDSIKATLKQDIMDGNIYLNIHTTLNPAGEIRGIGLFSKDLYIDILADNAQLSMPPTTTVDVEAAGHGYINAAFDQWRYFIVYEEDSLSGPIAAVNYVHNGMIRKTITGVSGGKIAGTWNASDLTQPLTDQDIRAFLYGEMRIVISTAGNITGELEGSFIRAMREGYAFELSDEAEIPAPMVTKNPQGGGMVSISSRRSNAHYMLAWDSLSGPVTGSHFHLGVPGMTGGVLFGFMSNNNAAFGYFTEADGFAPGNELQFRRDSVYVNIHTADNAAGEIRGDVSRNYGISMATSIENLLVSQSGVSIYPNPASQAISLSAEVASPFGAQVEIIDLMGRVYINREESFQQGRNEMEFTISHLTPGIYLIGIKALSGETLYKRFVKK